MAIDWMTSSVSLNIALCTCVCLHRSADRTKENRRITIQKVSINIGLNNMAKGDVKQSDEDIRHFNTLHMIIEMAYKNEINVNILVLSSP